MPLHSSLFLKETELFHSFPTKILATVHQYLVLITLVACCSFVRVVHGAGVGNYFTYYETGGLGPSRWSFLELASENQCGGTGGTSGYGQSPVTISVETQTGTCDTNMEGYQFFPGTCTWKDLSFAISNNGVKVHPKDGTNCSFGQLNIPHTSNKFNALQFHIHTFSEHEIEGKGIGGSGFFPGELHVVHQEETGESYAVWGIMISVSLEDDKDHELFEWFLQGWEAVAAQVAKSCPNIDTVGGGRGDSLQDVITCPALSKVSNHATKVNFPRDGSQATPNVYDLVTADNFGVFTYKGGLTTPPCTEIVNWNLLDEPMQISESQLNRLETLILCYVEPSYGHNHDHSEKTSVESCKHATVASRTGSTSRPPQPLLGRTIIHRCDNGPDGVAIDDIGVLPESTEIFRKPERVSQENPNTRTSKCTKVVTEDCSDDKRYNPLASPNLKANAESWYDYEGYWVGTMQVLDNSGKPLKESYASQRFEHTLPYPKDKVFIFMNRTIKETRYYETVYYVYKPANKEGFCSFPVPAESSNTLGSGICGVNGYARVGEKYGTATHEKDGSVAIFYANGRFNGGTTGKVVPVNHDTFYSFVGGNRGTTEFEYSETETFSNKERTRISGSGQYFIISDLPPYSQNPLAQSHTYEAVQVSSVSFARMLRQAYSDNCVKVADQDPFISSGYCVDKANCPTEDDFRAHDPLYTESPYNDDAHITKGWIVYLVLWGTLLFAITLYWWHMHRVSAQEARFGQEFSRRTASSGSLDNLTMEFLQERFKGGKESDRNGVITTEELKSFIVNRMSGRDSATSFAASNHDQNRNPVLSSDANL